MPGASWLNRNLRWLLPLAVLAWLALIGAAIACLYFAILSSFRASEPYVNALSAARESGAVVAALGEPIEEGWLVTGSLSSSKSSGTAFFAIPIRGPSGRGTIHVQARRSGDTWTYRELVVVLEGRDTPIVLDGIETRRLR